MIQFLLVVHIVKYIAFWWGRNELIVPASPCGRSAIPVFVNAFGDGS
jgi:hypothetical protein